MVEVSYSRSRMPEASIRRGQDSPSVSVVIPTAGRSSVFEAAYSVLQQTYMPLEVIIVFDREEDPESSKLFSDFDTIRVIFTGGIGANGARMQGVCEAKGDIIAFLDDDDVWLPRKLERQVGVWRDSAEDGRYTLVSSRIALMDTNGQIQRIQPSRLLRADERVASYLFRCSSITSDVGLLHTSTLICDRVLALLEPWDVTLSRHQDWDWILRVSARPDVTIQMCPDTLVEIAAPDDRSISRSPDWRASLKWYEGHADQLTARERGDFLLLSTARIAIRARSRRGGMIAAYRAFRFGRPGVAAWMIWINHILFVDQLSALRNRFRRYRMRFFAG